MRVFRLSVLTGLWIAFAIGTVHSVLWLSDHASRKTDATLPLVGGGVALIAFILAGAWLLASWTRPRFGR